MSVVHFFWISEAKLSISVFQWFLLDKTNGNCLKTNDLRRLSVFVGIANKSSYYAYLCNGFQGNEAPAWLPPISVNIWP